MGCATYSFYTHLYQKGILLSVVLFSAKTCVRCKAVELHLNKYEVEFTKVMVDEDPVVAENLKSRGYLELPVLKIGDEWSVGYRPDDLDSRFKPAKVSA